MVHGFPFWFESWSPGGRLPLTTVMRKVSLGPVACSPAANDMPTLPGPISQTPLLQAKFVVISVGVRDDDGVGDGGGVGDGDGVGFGCAPRGGQRIYLSGTDYVAGGGWFSRSANIFRLNQRSSRAVRECAKCVRSCSCPLPARVESLQADAGVSLAKPSRSGA